MNKIAYKIYKILSTELDMMQDVIPSVREAMNELGYSFVLIKSDGTQIDTPTGEFVLNKQHKVII